MTTEQHERAEQCLEELMMLGHVLKAAANHCQLSDRWGSAIGALVYRLAHQASSDLGDIEG